MPRVKYKYCDQAHKIAATIKRGESRKWMNLAKTVNSLDAHIASCTTGCGRDLTGLPWPPP